jgi:hypothetical protein
MKKESGTFAFLTIMLSSFVSAGPIEGLEQLADGLIEAIMVFIRFVSDLIFNINTFDELLFAKILIFALVLLIVYTVIKQNYIFGGTRNRPIQWIISFAVSILAVRYLPDTFVEAILLQYGALAVGITVFLPLAIYFFFIHQSGIGPFGRRAGWIVFAASFFALWSFRGEDLGQANWIYIIAIVFIIISLIFDKTIHEYFGLSDMRRASALAKDTRRVDAQRKLEHLDNDKAAGYYNGKEKIYEKKKEHLIKVIKDNI